MTVRYGVFSSQNLQLCMLLMQYVLPGMGSVLLTLKKLKTPAFDCTE